jgi:tetratricopeptide (TPR) repeat protein
MLAKARLFVLLVLAFSAGHSVVFSQNVDDIQYREDYDRVNQIIKISDPARKADQLLAFYKGRPNLDIRIRNFADSNFTSSMEALIKLQNYALVKKVALSAASMRPKFAEAWFLYGVALKNEGKIDEAINAFAKSCAIESLVQAKAKQLLDNAYRAKHNGSLIGEDKLIKQAGSELK